jgi:general secretion pathway protein C
VNLKDQFAKWSEKLRALFESARARRPSGIMAMPGRTATVRAGKFSVPVIDWEKLFRKTFVYNSLALVVCAYFLADLLVLALNPYFPQAQPLPRRAAVRQEANTMSRYNLILTRNLFNERGLIPNADMGDTIDGPPVRTNLPLTLLGVIVLKDGRKSVASIDDKGGNQVWAVREKEIFGNNLTMQAIEDSRVVFINKAEHRREFLELPQDQVLTTRRAAPTRPGKGGITNAGGDRFQIDRKEVDTMLAPENFNKILTQARCVPNFEGGRPAGYRCFQIEPGSIYELLGMKDNDVICGINGSPVNDPAAAFNMLTGLKQARNIELCINRGGQVKNMQYDIN